MEERGITTGEKLKMRGINILYGIMVPILNVINVILQPVLSASLIDITKNI